MPSYLSYKRQMAVLDADDNEIESWITVRGNHIPIKKGQSKEDAVKSFIAGKKKNLVENHNSLVEAMNLEEKGYFKKDPKKRNSITQSAIEMGKEEKNLEELMEFGVKEGNAAKPESKKGYTIAHKDKSGNTSIIAEVSHKDVNSGESDYDKEYHKVRSELKEAFSDFPKFNIKDNFAVSENDYKRVVAEKYKDGVIGVTTETAEGLLLNHADFKDWDSAAKYAEKERAQHKINVGGSEKKEYNTEGLYQDALNELDDQIDDKEKELENIHSSMTENAGAGYFDIASANMEDIEFVKGQLEELKKKREKLAGSSKKD